MQIERVIDILIVLVFFYAYPVKNLLDVIKVCILVKQQIDPTSVASFPVVYKPGYVPLFIPDLQGGDGNK